MGHDQCSRDERFYTKLLKKLHWKNVNQHGVNTESELIWEKLCSSQTLAYAIRLWQPYQHYRSLRPASPYAISFPENSRETQYLLPTVHRQSGWRSPGLATKPRWSAEARAYKVPSLNCWRTAVARAARHSMGTEITSNAKWHVSAVLHNPFLACVKSSSI